MLQVPMSVMLEGHEELGRKNRSARGTLRGSIGTQTVFLLGIGTKVLGKLLFSIREFFGFLLCFVIVSERKAQFYPCCCCSVISFR